MFEDPAVRQAVLVLVTTLLLELLKWGRAKRLLETSACFLRCVAVALVGVGAIFNAWVPDGEMTLQEWWRLFWTAMMGVEFTYQWLFKYVADLRKGGR